MDQEKFRKLYMQERDRSREDRDREKSTPEPTRRDIYKDDHKRDAPSDRPDGIEPEKDWDRK